MISCNSLLMNIFSSNYIPKFLKINSENLRDMNSLKGTGRIELVQLNKNDMNNDILIHYLSNKNKARERWIILYHA